MRSWLKGHKRQAIGAAGWGWVALAILLAWINGTDGWAWLNFVIGMLILAALGVAVWLNETAPVDEQERSERPYGGGW